MFVLKLDILQITLTINVNVFNRSYSLPVSQVNENEQKLQNELLIFTYRIYSKLSFQTKYFVKLDC